MYIYRTRSNFREQATTFLWNLIRQLMEEAAARHTFPFFLSPTRWSSSRWFLRRWSRCRCLRRNCRSLGASSRRLHLRLSMDLNFCGRHGATGHLCKGTRRDSRAGVKSCRSHRIEEKHSILLPLSVPICGAGVVVRHRCIRAREVIRSRFLGCLVE